MNEVITLVYAITDNPLILFLLLFFLGVLNVLIPPIPLETLAVLGGYLSGTGHGNSILIWLASMSGMSAGNLLFYGWVRHNGQSLLHWSFIKKQITSEYLEKTQSWFHRYGIWTIYVGRFIPWMSFAIIFCCGILKISRWKVYPAIFISNLAFFGALVMVGRYVGEQWPVFMRIWGKVASWAGIIVVLTGIAGVVFYRFWHKKGIQLPPKIQKLYPVLQALLAAVLFGAGAPLAKLLLGNIEPVPLAAFLYLGSGLGLLLFWSLQGKGQRRNSGEAQLDKSDLPWLAGAILAGGVAAPIVLMFSLRDTPAATASLLLNFEMVATTLIAALVFKEAIGRRVWWAIAAITVAGIILSWNGGSEWGFSLGALGVISACILWGMDNNFTRNISAKNPLVITIIKGLAAGAVSLMLACLFNNKIPGFGNALKAMLLGSISYGASVALFIFALRHLGSARTSAFFGTAPFMGAIFSVLIFREVPSINLILVAPIMVFGVVWLLCEVHAHKHTHPAIQHNHNHRHDDGHHFHQHGVGEVRAEGSHSHNHSHPEMEHTHAHAPDINHRHRH
jgi:drug/metabolite transporter (DMT)-like permease/membrane protein DedA with SNARE-associated domain